MAQLTIVFSPEVLHPNLPVVLMYWLIPLATSDAVVTVDAKWLNQQ
jgi:hypothetical protein